MKFQTFIFTLLFCTGILCLSAIKPRNKNRDSPNILLIVADDLNYNTVDIFSSSETNITAKTPHIDQLAREGKRFTHAHVSIAVCQPSRGVIMTGMYGHQSGIEGFDYYEGDRMTLTEKLRTRNYMTGIIGKVTHSLPKLESESEDFDLIINGLTDDNTLGYGRDPQQYYQHSKSFFEKANRSGKPFFLMVNSHDPHRPFSGSEDEAEKWTEAVEKGIIPKPDYQYKTDEVEVPKFLPDIPLVRKEISQYYNSVRRLDETVGKILEALDGSGLQDNTVVIFLSDNGMSFPFAKTNCYLNSTKTPLIIKWPAVIEQNTVDSSNLISTIDFYPTIMEIVNIPIPAHTSGTSFLPALRGENGFGNEWIFTQFYETFAKNKYPMRTVQNKKYGYIFNAWSDDSTQFKNESMKGLTFEAMRAAGTKVDSIRDRVDFYLKRTKEEFYAFDNDPDALHNLIDDKRYSDKIQTMRNQLVEWMIKFDDPLKDEFETYLTKTEEEKE